MYHDFKVCWGDLSCMRLLPIVIVAAVACLVLGAGCANLAPAENRASSSGDRYEEGSAPSGAYPTATPVPTAGSASEQRLIRTGSISLEVQAVPAAVDGIRAIAERHQGYLSSSSLSNGSGGRPSATIVMRVPAGSFDAAMADLRAAGKSTAESVSAEDVTEQYVDLQAQKGAFERQLAQYNLVLQKALTVEDILATQAHIERVQVELDRLEGRLRYLDSRIDLATITVSLREPAPIGGDTAHGFVPALNAGIAGFFGMIDALIVLFFTLLPLAILGAAAVGAYRWYRRRVA